MKNNYLLSILILFISISQIQARTLKPTVKVFQLDTQTVHTCDTIHNRIIIKNDSIDIFGFIDTLLINYPNQVSGFHVVPIYGSWLSRVDSFGYTKIVFNTITDSIVLDYSYYIPCNLIMDGESSGNLILKDTITDKRKYTSYPSLNFISTVYNVNTIGYANLYIVPSPAVPISYSHLTAFGTVGEYINRTIVLESNSKLSTDFEGSIQFIDAITNGCDMYEIDSIIVQIVNPILLSRTSISSIYYTPPILASSSPIFTLPIHLNSTQGEYIEIREVIHIISDSLETCIDNCPDNRIQSLLTVNYGCDSNLCKTLHTNAFIYRGSERPIIKDTQITSLGNWDTACFQTSSFTTIPSAGQLIHHTHIIKNKGLSVAYNVNLILRSTVKTSEVVAKSWVDATYNGTIINANNFTYYIQNPLRPDSIMPTCIESFKDLLPSDTDMYTPIFNMSWAVPVLNPNDSIVIHFDSYRCCPSDTNKYVGNFTYPEYFDTWGVNGFLDSIDDKDDHFVARDECGDEVRLQTSANQGIVLADIDVGSILGPAHLTGHNNSCDTTLTQYYDIPLATFCNGAAETRNEALLALFHNGPISGQLEIEIITDMGLNSSTSVSHPIYIEGSVFTGSTIRYATTTYSSYGLSGGNTEAFFSVDSLHADTSLSTYHNLLNYLSDAYLRIPITPCCNGLPIPAITVRFYLKPTRGYASTCINCKIPIGTTTRTIQLHCPGCITPGIIADNCKVRRETVGYPDLNNNGIADGTSPYSSIDAITRNRYAGKYYIPSDEMSLSFEGYGTDGIDSLGFSYQSLQNYWQTRHATDINYPTKFTDLYIYVSNACAALDEFNWTVMGDTLHWSRPGGLSGMTLLAPYLVHGADYLFYRVPIRAIGDSIGMQDYYKINMRLKACANGQAADCNINTFLWWSGDSTMPYNSFGSTGPAGDVNDQYKDSLYAFRQAQMSPGLIYYCEGHGDMITAFHLKREYSCIWQDKANEEFSTSISCNKKLIDKCNIKVVTVNENLVNLFSYEYRPLALEFTNDFYRRPPMLPPNYVLHDISNNSLYTNWSTLINKIIKNTTIGVNTSLGSFNNYQVPSAISMVVEGSLPVDSATSFVHCDERTHVEVTYNFEPSTCGVPDSTIQVNTDSDYAHIRYVYCPSDTITDTLEINNPFYKLTNPNPKIQLRLISGPVAAYSSDVNCFTVRLINTATSGQLAENLWVHALRPNLGGSIVSITEVASSVGVDATSIASDSAAGLTANVNHLTRNQFIDLQICFDVNTCITPDSIQLIYGYSCIEGMNCFSDTLAINLEKATIQIVHYVKDSILNMHRCKMDTIECRFRVLNAGEIDHLQAGIDVPLGVRVLSQQATYRDYMMPGTPSDTLAMDSISTTLSGGWFHHFYEYNADTALHGTPSINRSELEIVISFTIGSCIDTLYKPLLWLRGIGYCNNVIVDSIKNIRVRPTGSISSSCHPIDITLDSIRHASCRGSHDGAVRIIRSTITDSFGRVTYLWSTGDTGIRIRNLVAGTYTVTATDGYGCADTASFTINALTNPIQLPTISYQPYTTCDLRADSVVFTPYLPIPPSPLPLPYYPPIPHYTYTWTATNIDSTFPSTGTILGGTSLRHVIPIRFADSLIGSTIVIRASDSFGCYDEIRIWIEPCCVRSEPLISNTSLSRYFTDSTVFTSDSTYYIFGSYRINGTFLIDKNCVFTTGTFYMEPFSQIIIAPNIKADIIQKVIVACDTTMWKGIIIGRNSVLNVHSSRIYDALIGISTRQTSYFDIRHSYMNRNFIDIDVRAYNLTRNPSRILDCHLFSHNETIEYFGNTTPRSRGRCWYPHREEQSYMGIAINQNLDFMVGDTLRDTSYISIDTSLFTNYIEDKLYGIYSTESGLETYYTNFNNIRSITGYCDIITGRYLLDSAGDAIHFEALYDLPTRGKQLVVKHCKFNNIYHAGITTTGAFVTGAIKLNRMTSVRNGILNMNITNTGLYNPLLIDTNYIAYNSIGIGCNNVRRLNIHIIGDTLIASNAVFSLCGGRNKTGIRIAMPGLDAATNSMIAIRDNLIMNGTSGIEIQSINTMPSGIVRNSIIHNTILSTLNDNGFAGIRFTNSHNFSIGWNTISGRPTVPADRTSLVLNKKGIFLNSSSLNTINCNNFDYMFKGFEYMGRCTMPQRLFNNQFNHLGNHIFCSDTLGFLGNIANAGVASPRFHSNSMNFTAANYSIFNLGSSYRYSRQGPGVYNPSSFVTTTIPPLGVILVSSFVPLSSCTSAPPPLLRLGATDSIEMDTVSYEEARVLIEGISSEEDYTPDNMGYEVLSKEQIYDMLLNDSILGDKDSIVQFILQMQDEDIATYKVISEAIQAQDYAYAQALTNALGDESYPNQAYEQWFNLWNSIDYNSNINQGIYNDSILLDSLIANECLPFSNYYKLNETTLNELMNLANLCPFRYGQAVYNARVLINTQNGYEDMNWDDEQICYNAIGYKKDNSDPELFSESATNPNIGIYPNPASTLLNYKISSIDKSKCEQITSIKLYTGTGVLLYSSLIPLNTKEGIIDISKYTEGIYIINFKCMDGSNTMYKFVIKH